MAKEARNTDAMHTETSSARDAGQTIRVFVSSTFRDMHAERDALNRAVFPELRRRCQTRAAEFVGLDLRWGVTEDEIQRDGTLAICLHEIAKCRPFFVCLLGDRFGSVYPPDEVPVDLWEAARREVVLRPLVEKWYRRDDTVSPSAYRLRRERDLHLSEARRRFRRHSFRSSWRPLWPVSRSWPR